MITKKEFVECIEFIRKQRENENKFIEGLESLSKGSYCDCFLYGEYEDKLVDILANMLEDKDEDITYYLYELNGIEGKEIPEDKFPIDEKTGKPLYTSLETLYNYLIGNITSSIYDESSLFNYIFDPED